eukprot:scaffold20578_cov124-Isochrysis_galbana.AAC.1
MHKSRGDASAWAAPAARSCAIAAPSADPESACRSDSGDTAGGSSLRVKGKAEPARCKNTTAYPACRNCSADAAPRFPVEKLSMNRTVLRSSGTVVPPDVTSAIVSALCLEKKASSWSRAAIEEAGSSCLYRSAAID